MDIITAPDSRLRVKTKPVKKITSGLLKIIEEMIKLTATFADPEGVGLASTQVGKDEKMFVMKKTKGDFEVIFNPEILSYGKKTKVFFEGCLSIPNFYGEVKRPTSIKVRFLDKKGNLLRRKLEGMEAWIFQHECDHLEGKLFVDKVLEQGSRMFKVIGKDRAGAEVFEEIRL